MIVVSRWDNIQNLQQQKCNTSYVHASTPAADCGVITHTFIYAVNIIINSVNEEYHIDELEVWSRGLVVVELTSIGGKVEI